MKRHKKVIKQQKSTQIKKSLRTTQKDTRMRTPIRIFCKKDITDNFGDNYLLIRTLLEKFSEKTGGLVSEFLSEFFQHFSATFFQIFDNISAPYDMDGKDVSRLINKILKIFKNFFRGHF